MGQLLQRWACFVFCLFVIFYLLFLRAKWDKEGRKVVKCARFWREKSHTFSLFSINGWNNIYYYDSWRQKIVFIIYGITLRFFWMAESKLEKFGSLFSKNFAKSMEILWKYVGRHSKPSSIFWIIIFFKPFFVLPKFAKFFFNWSQSTILPVRYISHREERVQNENEHKWPEKGTVHTIG